VEYNNYRAQMVWRECEIVIAPLALLITSHFLNLWKD